MESVIPNRYPWQLKRKEVQNEAQALEQTMEIEVSGGEENAEGTDNAKQPPEPRTNDDLDELERSLVDMERVIFLTLS